MLQVYDIMPRVLAVLELLCQGYTLTAACDKNSIGVATFRKHVNSNVELKEMFEEAEQRGFDTLADYLIDPFGAHGNKVTNETEAKKAKLVSDNIKWYLSRKRPTQYGDRSVVEHTITADKAIIEAMQQGNQRAMRNVIEGVVVEEVVTPQLPPELLQFVK